MRRKQRNRDHTNAILDQIFGSQSAGNSLSQLNSNLYSNNMSMSAEHNEESMPVIMNLVHEPQAAQIAAIVVDLEQSPPNTHWLQPSGCTCDKSRCVKSYCKCYGANNYCRPNCKCMNCLNNEQNKDAFKKVRPRKKWGCDCKRKSCLKKYCYCVSNGKKCTKYCECVNCCNQAQQPSAQLMVRT